MSPRRKERRLKLIGNVLACELPSCSCIGMMIENATATDSRGGFGVQGRVMLHVLDNFVDCHSFFGVNTCTMIVSSFCGVAQDT